MRLFRKSLFQALLGTILLVVSLMAAQGATTDISESPMAAKNNVPPNFMFIIDNSLSMNNIVVESPYDASATYLGSPTDAKPCANVMPSNLTYYRLVVRNVVRNGSIVYRVPYLYAAGSYFGASSKWGCGAYCSMDTAGTGGNHLNWDTRKVCFDNTATYKNVHLNNSGACDGDASVYCNTSYSGHYLNWYFGGYSGAGQSGWNDDRNPLTNSRFDVAKAAAKAALDSIPLPTSSTGKAKVRVGLSTFVGSQGRLLFPMTDLLSSNGTTSTALTNIKTKIDDANPAGATPLAGALADVGRYFTLGNGTTLHAGGTLTLHPDQTSPAPPQAEIDDIFPTTIVNYTGLPHKDFNPYNTCKSGDDSTKCPVQYWCQRNYAFLMTDGRATTDHLISLSPTLCDYDGDGQGYDAATGKATGWIGNLCKTGTQAKHGYDMKTSTSHSPTKHLGGAHSYETILSPADYLNDVAQALYEMDLRPDIVAPNGRSKKNNLTTYTIGFANGSDDDSLSNDPQLMEAAAQGGGDFLSATSTTELIQAFSGAMDKAIETDGASSAVAVVNTLLTTNNTGYASSYQSGYWVGDLNAFTIDSSTGIPSTTPIWSAKAKLDALSSPQTSRTIVTFDGTSGVAFQADSVTLDASLSTTENTDLINFLRGDQTKADGVNFRKRKSILGDITNAEPVVVNYDTGPYVFQGGNDGMLHVFDGCATTAAACGKELWAYIPRMVWPNLLATGGGLADPVYAHRFFIDATPAVADVGTTKLLVGGLGRGGMGYYALDITTATAASESGGDEATRATAKVKWEYPASASYPSTDIGYSYGTPLIVNSPSGWVVLVTSGYNNGSGIGKVFALDPLTGALQHTISTEVGDAATPSGLVYLSKLSTATATDTITYVYGGDLLGNVWRFNLSDWSATKIAELKDPSGATQPITSALAVGPVASGGSSKYFVYAGTGEYLGDSDVPGNTPQNTYATQQQSLYGIIDDTTIASPTLPDIRGSNGSTCPTDGGDGSFICQSMTTSGTSYTASHNALGKKSGWYFDLPVSNSRVVSQPAVTSGGALVATINIPTITICDPGGSSYFVNVDAKNGGAIATTYGGSDYYASITFIGYALSSRVVVVDAADARHGLIRTSDQGFKSPIIREPLLPTYTWKRLYWRELL